MKWWIKLISLIIIVLILGCFATFYGNTIRTNEIVNDKDVMKCIANNSILYTADTCLNCVNQEKILGKYNYFFEIIDCTSTQFSGTKYSECQNMPYTMYPIWIIEGKKYDEYFSLPKLKKITGC